METIEIFLEAYKAQGSKVFTGRNKGQRIRSESNIDNYISEGKNIKFIIPDDIMSINPSFLEELLFNIVKQLGKTLFFQRVQFENLNNRYDFQPDLEEAVERILRQKNALSK